MRADCEEACWICRLADTLACEIFQEMCEIHLKPCPRREEKTEEMDAVYGIVDGPAFSMKLQFQAEPKLFHRMAVNMIGEEPEDEEEVQEYAREVFNVLCGRFVSEIQQATRVDARFHPVLYEKAPHLTQLEHEDDWVNIIYYVSGNGEVAQFAWTRGSIEEVLRRKSEQ